MPPLYIYSDWLTEEEMYELLGYSLYLGRPDSDIILGIAQGADGDWYMIQDGISIRYRGGKYQLYAHG